MKNSGKIIQIDHENLKFKLKKTFEHHTMCVHDIICVRLPHDPRTRRLISGGQDCRIFVLNMKNYNIEQEIIHPHKIDCIIYDRENLLFSDWSGYVYVWKFNLKNKKFEDFKKIRFNSSYVYRFVLYDENAIVSKETSSGQIQVCTDYMKDKVRVKVVYGENNHNHRIETNIVRLKKHRNLIAFGESYPDVCVVLNMDDYSVKKFGESLDGSMQNVDSFIAKGGKELIVSCRSGKGDPIRMWDVEGNLIHTITQNVVKTTRIGRRRRRREKNKGIGWARSSLPVSDSLLICGGGTGQLFYINLHTYEPVLVKDFGSSSWMRELCVMQESYDNKPFEFAVCRDNATILLFEVEGIKYLRSFEDGDSKERLEFLVDFVELDFRVASLGNSVSHYKLFLL